MIDTHCHLNLMVSKEFNGDLSDAQVAAVAQIIDQAAAVGVTHMINIGATPSTSLTSIKLAQTYPNVFATVGIHPTDLESDWQDNLTLFAKLLADKQDLKIVGVGETGIDRYHEGPPIDVQKAAFCAHIELALQHALPIIVHTRKAPEETLDVLTRYKNQLHGGVVHCFPYDGAFANEIIALGLYLGVGGVVTYPKSVLPAVVKQVGLEHIVLETDAPYLAPQAMRGTQNTPAYVALIAQAIADLLNTSLEQVDQITTHNAKNLFLLP